MLTKRFQHIKEAQSGLAGFIATGPMSLFMLATQRFLPQRQQYALAPEIITEELAHRAHVRWHLNKMQVKAATLVSHFGYGGCFYGRTLWRIGEEDLTSLSSKQRF